MPGTGLALAASFAGVLLIIRPGSALFGPAAVLPLLAALFATGYTLSTRKLAVVDDGVSTLFIGGASTKGTLPKVLKALASNVSGSRTEMIPGTTHPMFEQAPQRYCEIVLSYLEED